MIDWSRMQSPAMRAAAALAAQQAAIRRHRDAALAAGIEVAGLRVATDDLAQARLTGAALAALADPAAGIRWKQSDGQLVPLSAAAVLAIAGAVRAHVQACFDHEAGLLAALAAGQAPDPARGWPGQG